MSYRLPVFNKRAKRILISHPKFYFFDAGVYNFLRPKGPLDSPEEIAGPALEGLVLQNLYAYFDGINSDAGVYYWRTKSGAEIDFIVYGKELFYAIEVKNTKKIRNEDLKALTSFRRDYPIVKSYLLYRGVEKIIIDDVLIIPVDDFLVNIDKYLPASE